MSCSCSFGTFPSLGCTPITPGIASIEINGSTFEVYGSTYNTVMTYDKSRQIGIWNTTAVVDLLYPDAASLAMVDAAACLPGNTMVVTFTNGDTATVRNAVATAAEFSQGTALDPTTITAKITFTSKSLVGPEYE